MRQVEPFLFGNELARVFGLPVSRSLLLRTHNSALGATHLVSSSGRPAPTKPIAAERGFAIPVQLGAPDAANWGSWIDGQYTHTPKWQQGGIGIYDLESDPRICWDTEFEVLCFNVPYATLNAFTEDARLPSVNRLNCPEGLQDPVLHHLAQMMVLFIREERVLPDLFVEHYLRMLCGRLVTSYGDASSSGRSHRGGFAPWQMRRVNELVESDLSGDLRLNRLASECGLSASYFCRCFRITFGTSVHRFVVSKRVERARRLLLQSNLPLAEIALEAGFSDQAVFSRTFGAVVGTPPARWRTEHLIRTRQSSKPATLSTTRILDTHKPSTAGDKLPNPMTCIRVA